ncbi:MAG TPA: hypothetical protein VM509_08105 [Planctomycetota bacterium]|nr:hypothetical protein [Planctomycetota bacterium]
MRPPASIVAWCASLAPLLLERAGVLDFALAGPAAAPRLGLCALAWIALAGLPCAGSAPREPHSWWGSAMASLPVLATASALDVESGAALAHAIRTAIWALAFVALTGLAAELAHRRATSRGVHAAVWLAVFLGAPMFAAAFHFGARASAFPFPTFVRSLANSSPLQWSLHASTGAASPYTAFAALVVLCALAAHFGRGAEA